VKGFVLTSVGAAMIMLGLSLFGSHLVDGATPVAMCSIGAIALVMYYRHSTQIAYPAAGLPAAAHPHPACQRGGSLFIGLGAVPFLLPLALQEGLGMTAFQAGSITCASAFGSLFIRLLASRVLRRYGFRTVLMVNAVFAGIALAAYGIFSMHTPYLLIVTIVLMGGVFPALQFTCLNSIAYADIDNRDAGRVTSLASVIQQLSLGLGVTVAGIVLQLSNHLQGHSTIVAADFWPAFVVIGLFSVASVPISGKLPHNAGLELSQGK
jgi:MFS family permease